MRWLAPLLIVFLLLSSGTPLEPTLGEVRHTSHQIEAEIVSWRVGDEWRYDVELDAVKLVDESPDLAGSYLNILRGDARMWVAEASLYNDSGEVFPAYRVEITASVDGDGSFPEPNTGIFASGTLYVTYGETRWVRTSDLAILERTQSMHLMFDAFGIWEEVIADFNQVHDYTPAQEAHDFPIGVGEQWNTASDHSEVYSGASGPVDLPAGVEEEELIIVYNVVELGESPPSGFGCEDAFRIDWNNTEGEILERHWWCPAVRNDVYWWTDDIAMDGVDGEFWLTSYTPASQVRHTIGLDRTSSPLKQTVNVTTSDASATLWYHGQRIEFNGSSSMELNIGNRMDNTPTSEDWGTHGIVVCTDVESNEMACEVLTIALEGSAIGALLREDAFSRAPPMLNVGHQTANRLALSLRF